MYDCFRGSLLIAVVLAAGATLSACGGSDSSPSTSASSSDSSSGANQAPTISGQPSTSAAVGTVYNFSPSATDADKDTLTFSIESKPGWATFDAKTGRLSGSPTAADVGSHEGIVVKVSDGMATTALPEFSVLVSASGQGTGSATLSWYAPSENSDGSALANLSGYKIHYGTTSGSYSETIDVDTAGLTTYVVDNLPTGTYYFTITSVASGVESDYSSEVSATIG